MARHFFSSKIPNQTERKKYFVFEKIFETLKRFHFALQLLKDSETSLWRNLFPFPQIHRQTRAKLESFRVLLARTCLSQLAGSPLIPPPFQKCRQLFFPFAHSLKEKKESFWPKNWVTGGTKIRNGNSQ